MIRSDTLYMAVMELPENIRDALGMKGGGGFDLVLFAITIMVIVVLAMALIHIRKTRVRQTEGYVRRKDGLFNRLCAVHDLDPSQVGYLKAMVDHVDPREPGELFVSKTLFEKASRLVTSDVKNPVDPETVQHLGRKIFGPRFDVQGEG